MAQEAPPSPSVLLTIKAAPTILVDVLCEAVFLEQLAGRMLELGQRLRGTAIAFSQLYAASEGLELQRP